MNFHRREADRDAPLLGGVVPILIQREVYPQLYTAHPEPAVDLACINLTTLRNPTFPLFWRHLFPELFATLTEEDLTIGTKVWFVGYPATRFDQAHNLPLTRVGHIASVPSLDFNDRPEFVVDAPVFPGSSGSPVFARIEQDPCFVGVISETMIQNQQLQTLPTASVSFVSQVIGLGIVIKAPLVQQLVEAAVEKIRQGFVPHGGVELVQLPHGSEDGLILRRDAENPPAAED